MGERRARTDTERIDELERQVKALGEALAAMARDTPKPRRATKAAQLKRDEVSRILEESGLI